MPNRDLIFVLGSGRSGSSALTRVLSLCGCSLPPTVFGADDHNAMGFWEPTEAARLNLDFLLQHGWMNKRQPTQPPAEIICNGTEREHYIRRIRAFLASCESKSALIIKEPLINELAEFWFEAARNEGYFVKVVIAIRPPSEVAASSITFAMKKGWPVTSTENQSVWWLRSNLLAERQSRKFPRAFVEYSNLLREWRTEVDRISSCLSVNMHIDEDAIDRFLTPSLHRQQLCDSTIDTLRGLGASRAYAILSSAAKGDCVNLSDLDQLYREHTTSASTLNELRAGVDLEPLREYFKCRPIWSQGIEY